MGKIVYTGNHGYLSNVKEYCGNLVKLTISCGGGMGGSKWKIITKDNIPIDELNNNKFIKITKVNGQEYTVNTKYIVDMVHIDVKFDNGWIYEHLGSDYSTIYTD